MAKIRVNHFGSETIDTSASVDWEALLSEIFIAFLLAAFAYMGYKAQFAFLFFPCAIASSVVTGYLIYSIVISIRERFSDANRKNKSESNNI